MHLLKLSTSRQVPAFPFILVLMVCLFSCKKDKEDTGASSTEIADVKTSGAIKYMPLTPTPGTETITAITLKNTNDGSGTVHVKLSLDNAEVTRAGLMPLPANSYTLATLEYDVPGNGTIAVPLVINRSNLTVDTTYGIAFTITSVSAGVIADAKAIVVKIGLRNRWDGRYTASGTMVDLSQPTYGFETQELLVITTGPTQVKVIPVLLGIPGYIIKIGSNRSFYADFGPVLNFDANTNKVVSMVNFYGQPATNTRSAELDASGSNQWNATTKNMAIKFWMNQPSVVSPHRSAFDNTWAYLKER